MPDIYGTVTGFNAYHLARDASWADAYEDEAVTAALIVGSEWLDARHRAMWPGTKVGGREQVRDWPRTGVVDIDGYAVASTEAPREIVAAAYEAALKELTSSGSLSIDYTPNKYKSARVDGAVSVEYMNYDNAIEAQTRFAIIDEILLPLMSRYVGGMVSNLSGSTARG